MDITPLVKEGQKIIQSYGVNGFKIGAEEFRQAVIVFPDEVIPWQAGVEFEGASINLLLERANDLDVILFGTGGTICPLPEGWHTALKEAGINADVMDTGAACRTYNVLMAEGRRVAAALLAL